MSGKEEKKASPVSGSRLGLTLSAAAPILETEPDVAAEQTSVGGMEPSPGRAAGPSRLYDTQHPAPALPPINTIARPPSESQPSTGQHINLMTFMEAEKAKNQQTPASDDTSAFKWGGSMPRERDSVYDPRASKRERLSVRGKILEQHFKGMRSTPTFAFSGMGTMHVSDVSVMC